MSRENQHALGLEVAAQVYEQMPVLPDSSAETQYIRQLGQKLVATIPPQYSWPFEFHVVAQKEINAFALPGGPMFINLGTITAAATEAELAGVMAHEMAHIYMQHSAKRAGKAQTTSVLAGIASIALGAAAGGIVGQLGQMGIQMGAQGVMLRYSRSDESEADQVGTIILYKAGYNPVAMADFFKTLQAQGGSSPPQWLSSHPSPGNRQQAIEKEIQNWPPQNFTSDSAAFQKIRRQAKGVKAYTAQEIAQGAKSGQWAALNKKNGATLRPTGGNAIPASRSETNPTSSAKASAVSLNSVTPSHRMVNETLGPISIDRPENWEVRLPDQQGEFLVIAPEAGVTNNGVGYGVLFNGTAPQAKRMSIGEITSNILTQLQQKNGLELLQSAQAITVGGSEGRSVMLRSPSPFLDSKVNRRSSRIGWLLSHERTGLPSS
jgi:predicted Zn-dependent protease